CCWCHRSCVAGGPGGYCRCSRQWSESWFSSYILQRGQTGQLPRWCFSIYDNGNRERDAHIESASDEMPVVNGDQRPPAADDPAPHPPDGAGDGRLLQLAAAALHGRTIAAARPDDHGIPEIGRASGRERVESRV